MYKTACTQTKSFLIVINSVSFSPDYTRSLSSFSSIVTMSLPSLIIFLSLILTMSLSSPISSLIIFSVSSPQQQCHCHEYDSVNGSVCVAGTWYVFNVSDSVFWSTLWLVLCRAMARRRRTRGSAGGRQRDRARRQRSTCWWWRAVAGRIATASGAAAAGEQVWHDYGMSMV